MRFGTKLKSMLACFFWGESKCAFVWLSCQCMNTRRDPSVVPLLAGRRPSVSDPKLPFGSRQREWHQKGKIEPPYLAPNARRRIVESFYLLKRITSRSIRSHPTRTNRSSLWRGLTRCYNKAIRADGVAGRGRFALCAGNPRALINDCYGAQCTRTAVSRCVAFANSIQHIQFDTNLAPFIPLTA